MHAMIKKRCKQCRKTFLTYPCRVNKRFCSMKCYSNTRTRIITMAGVETRFKEGHVPAAKIMPEIMRRGKNHPFWKGHKVGYRGLHYWLRRIKGIPKKCLHCGFRRTTPKSMHWASKDGTYRRDPRNFIPLCTFCHAAYDR